MGKGSAKGVEGAMSYQCPVCHSNLPIEFSEGQKHTMKCEKVKAAGLAKTARQKALEKERQDEIQRNLLRSQRPNQQKAQTRKRQTKEKAQPIRN